MDHKAQVLHLVDSIIDAAFDIKPDGSIIPRIKCESVHDLKALIEVALKLIGGPDREELHITFNVKKYQED